MKHRSAVTIYERNFTRLQALMGQPLGSLDEETVYRLQAPGFMDLVVEVLQRSPKKGTIILSLCHYFEQNGDLCQDPDMELRVFLPEDDRPGTVEALTFQQAIPPVYQRVYPEPGKVNPRLKQQLNHFLGLWLRNLKQQGHRRIAGEGS
jgi:uncharacterized protein YqiB (DUF1249 family)